MINATIIKRIAALESRLTSGSVAALIMIHWDSFKESWVIKETFTDGKTKESTIDHYKNYIFEPSFNGSVILDLMEIDENLYSFTAKEIRKQAAIAADHGFSIEFIQNTGNKESVFSITEYQ